MNKKIPKYDIYERFKQILELTKLVKVEDSQHKLRYNKMVQTGELNHYDYGVGFLCFETFIVPEKSIRNGFKVRIWIATIDDGDFGGWSEPMTEGSAKDIVRKIANEVMEDMNIFPSDKKLNEMLRPYKMFVELE